MRRLLAICLAALAALVPVASADAKRPRDLPSRAQATAALEKVRALREGRGVRSGFELTPALARLSNALPSLGAADRREAEALLARPDDAQADPADTHKWSVPEATKSPHCTASFCIHWVSTSSDAPPDAMPANTPDSVQALATILEAEVLPCQNGTGATECAGTPGQGWRGAASDGSFGGDGRTDVYIQDLFANEGVFGYVARDPGQPDDPAVPHHAYMVMDKDYARYGDGSPESGVAAASVTAAHEYNHVLQNAYDYLQDSWMFEASSVFMEEKTYPGVNDYLDYVKAWAVNTKQPLTTFTSENLKPYGAGVWNHWLAHRFGPPVVRSAWEGSVAAGNFAPGAYGTAIAGAGGASFGDEFARFAVASAEWNVPGSGFPDPYPDIHRDGTLPADTITQPFALPHTTYSLLDVPVPAGAAVIRLVARLPDGTAGAVALVGRTGTDPAAGSVTSNLTPMPTGGTGAVQLENPGAFGRITAVVVNADASRAGFDPARDDYIFTRDADGVIASLSQPGVPVPVTGAPALVGDHGAFVGAEVDPHLLDTTWSIEYGRTSSYGSRTATQSVAASTVGAARVSAGLPDLEADTTYHYRVVAGNAAGSAAGADMTLRTAKDVRPPTVSVKTKRQKTRTARRRGAIYLARCSERCFGRAELVLARRTARRLRLPRVIGKSRIDLEVQAKSASLKVRLSPRARKRLAGHRRSLRLTLVVRVADDSRNRAVVRRAFQLRP